MTFWKDEEYIEKGLTLREIIKENFFLMDNGQYWDNISKYIQLRHFIEKVKLYAGKLYYVREKFFFIFIILFVYSCKVN